MNNDTPIGSSADIINRLKAVLPNKWFSDQTPVLDALLAGLAASWVSLYALLQSVGAQARIGTASGIWLDIAASDYLGLRLPRRTGETDSSYRLRIKTNLTTPRATRIAVSEMLSGLTGRNATIFEPLNPADTGGYGSVGLGYNAIGGYGCLNIPYQFFITAYRPDATPTPNQSGYNTGPGRYNTAPLSYAGFGEFPNTFNDADILADIAAALPTGAIAWTRISS
ncbi:MAG TPA: hypothetical protein PLI12_02875 [Acetobacteraceae bacterium]|nr:hypothetical protein [Acetobacteraceae bacterium]